MRCQLIKDGRPQRHLSYPVFQKSREPSEPPLANRPSWTGCQATAGDKSTRGQGLGSALLPEPRLLLLLLSPVASFLCPLNTCSSSFRFLMSNSLHRWSRDAVSSQFPFRFHFTSITVFLWAWLRRHGAQLDTSCSRHSLRTSLNLDSQRGQTLSRLRVPELDWLLAVLTPRHHQAFGGMPVHTLDVCTVT